LTGIKGAHSLSAPTRRVNNGLGLDTAAIVNVGDQAQRLTSVGGKILQLSRVNDSPSFYRGVGEFHHRQRQCARRRWLRDRSCSRLHYQGSAIMAPLLFICPKTNQQAPTGIQTDAQSLSASWKAMLKVNCPHCGKVHQISVRETYIEGALDAVHRLRQAI
jgi:hypothetical protein